MSNHSHNEPTPIQPSYTKYGERLATLEERSDRLQIDHNDMRDTLKDIFNRIGAIEKRVYIFLGGIVVISWVVEIYTRLIR